MFFNSCNDCDSCGLRNNVFSALVFPDFVRNSCCNPCCTNFFGNRSGCGCDDCGRNRCGCGCDDCNRNRCGCDRDCDDCNRNRCGCNRGCGCD